MNGEIFTHRGVRFRLLLNDDDIGRKPWDDDEHALVSLRFKRDKRPYEIVLSTGRDHNLFFNMRRATIVAFVELWGLSQSDRLKAAAWFRTKPDRLTRRQVAAYAAQAYFEFLRRWCRDEWRYIALVIERLDDEGEAVATSSGLWGIESDAIDYIREVAREQADELIKGDEQ